MTISATAYWVFIISLIIIIAAGFHFAGKKRGKKAIQSIGLLLAIIIFVGNKWVFPNVYFVAACGKVSKEVMLFPKTVANGTSLSFGRHCYLINNSPELLQVATIIYGNINVEKSPEKMIDETVPSGSAKQFNTISLDYFFEPEEKTVYTKQDGEIKYSVNCSK